MHSYTCIGHQLIKRHDGFKMEGAVTATMGWIPNKSFHKLINHSQPGTKCGVSNHNHFVVENNGRCRQAGRISMTTTVSQKITGLYTAISETYIHQQI